MPIRPTHTITPSGDGEILVKRYRGAAPGEPHREWAALRLLHRHVPGLAPRPLNCDLAARPPWLAMERVDGSPLGGRPLTGAQLVAVVAALDRMHRGVPEEELPALPASRADPRVQLDRVRSALAVQSRRVGDPIVLTAYDTAVRWCESREVDRLVGEAYRPVLARADHHLPNFLWDGDRIRLVDFEDSGRGDRCSEFAEVVEHLSARCTPDQTWQDLLDGLTLSSSERRRVSAARRLSSIGWFLLLMPGRPASDRNPPGTLHAQAQRVLSLI